MPCQKKVVTLQRILSVVLSMAQDSDILSAVRQMREQFEAALAENQRLSQELNNTKKALARAENQIDDLNAKYDRLRLAKAYGWNGAQKRAATDRITKLVREIDSCLSLMKKMN